MKTLYIDIDEKPPQILGKLEYVQSTKVLLIIPRGAVVLRNKTHIKVLQQKLLDQKKELFVFTNDKRAQKTLKQLGIQLYKGPHVTHKKRQAAKLKSLPVKNIKKQGKRKVSLTEVSEKKRQQKKRAMVSSPLKREQSKQRREWAKFLLFSTINKRIFASFFVMAFAVFFLVVYIAIPSAEVTIIPAKNILDKTINVTLADPQQAPQLLSRFKERVIPSYVVQLDLERSMDIPSTGQVFEGQHATCLLKITNDRLKAWPLIERTRFMDESGVVFRIDKAIEVPRAQYQTVSDEDGEKQVKVPGTMVVEVRADERDQFDNIIGSRGNLPAGTKFSLPGLSEFNQGIIYAESEDACTGGVSEFYQIVTQEDLDAARLKIKEYLEKESVVDLKAEIEKENIRRLNTETNPNGLPQLILFDNTAAIQFDLKDVNLPLELLNQPADKFSVTGNMVVKALSYEKQAFNDLLEEGLLSKVHPDKILSQIDFQSITTNIVRTDSDLEGLSKIKLSVNVRGSEEYNFDPRSERGKQLMNTILNFVPNKNQQEAIYFINNLAEVDGCQISVWPFWKTNLPERRSSINILIDQSI